MLKISVLLTHALGDIPAGALIADLSGRGGAFFIYFVFFPNPKDGMVLELIKHLFIPFFALGYCSL